MYQYPLTFTFPAFSLTPQITVKDSRGAVVLKAAKKLLSSKEEVHVTVNGQQAYLVVSQENRITDIPSNWDIKAANGSTLAVVDDDFLSAIDTSQFIPRSPMSAISNMEISRALNLHAAKMYWINNTEGKHMGLIAPDQASLVGMQLPIDRLIRQLPGMFFRLITPSYYVRLDEETVMFLQKKRTFMLDTYTLEARGKFDEAQEAILVNSVLLTLVYERQHLKELYS